MGVWRIPADFRDFRFGITSDRPNIIAWYDLNSIMGKLRDPLFATPDGIGVKPSATIPSGTASFAIDGLEIRPGGLAMPQHIAGARVDPAKPAHVVTLTVTNRLLLPAGWGWPYVNVEFIGVDGTSTAPRTVRLTLVATGRQVEIGL